MDRVQILKKIVPEIFESIEQRYLILRAVHFSGPIGRRNLAKQMNLSERAVRNEVDILVRNGLLTREYAGMLVTADGEEMLSELKQLIRQNRALGDLEKEFTEALSLKTAIIVPGDSDRDEVVKQDLAVATAKYLRSVLRDGDTLAVTGGTTLSQVATAFPAEPGDRKITVVPARGGLGEDVALQANSVAASLAQHLGGQYRLLHAPDNVEARLLDTIVNEPRIREVIALVRRSQVLLHGIGTAEEMAKRRGLDDTRLMQLIADGAVGEAFGYYFDAAGKVVYSTTSIGLRMEDLAKIPLVIAVGGGRSKAYAVLSVLSTGHCDVCITDEGAARRLMRIKEKGGNKNGN